ASRARSDLHLLLHSPDLRALSAADRLLRHRSSLADRARGIVRHRRHDRRHDDGNRPHPGRPVESRARIAARDLAHRLAAEIARGLAASDDRAAPRSRLQRDRHHRRRIHSLHRGDRPPRGAGLQQFRQSDHVCPAGADPRLRHLGQRGARRIRAGAAPALVPLMTARSRLLDYLLLGIGAWLAWLALFQWAGPEALSPPGATLRRASEYLASGPFWGHAAATGLAFFYGCLVALIGGLGLGFSLGAPAPRGAGGGRAALRAFFLFQTQL